MKFGERLKLELSARGMNQADLCRLVADLDKGTLSALIKNDQSKSRYAPAIAEALGVNVLWLLTGTEPKDRIGKQAIQQATTDNPYLVSLAPQAVTIDLPAEAISLWVAVQKLPPDLRKVRVAQIYADAANLDLTEANERLSTPLPSDSTRKTQSA